jgi:hypothetical protein
MICMPLPRNGNDKCSGDDPAFLCHVPAALCSFALCSLAWMRSPRRNGSFCSTSLHHLEQAIESGPVWQPVYLGTSYTATNPQARSARVGQARATRVRVLDYVG